MTMCKTLRTINMLNSVTETKSLYFPNLIIESKSKKEWSLLEKKFIVSMAAMVKPSSSIPNHNYKYTLSHNDFQLMTNCSTKNIPRDIREVSESMLEQYTLLPCSDNLSFDAFSWLTRCKYDNAKGLLDITINSDLIPYLLDLGKYTQFEIETILDISSSHAIQIYLLSKSYLHFCQKYKKPFTKTIVEVKENLGLQNKYKQIIHFQEKVLNIAKREINNKTDITVEYKLIKEGRKYTKIEFFVKRKKQIVIQKDDQGHDTRNNSTLLDRLLECNFTEKAAKTLIARYSNEKIEFAIDKIEEKIKNKEHITSIPALLTTIVKSHYSESKNNDAQTSIHERIENDQINKQNQMEESQLKWTEIESFCTVNADKIERLYDCYSSQDTPTEEDDLFKHELFLFTGRFSEFKGISRLIPTMFINGSPKTFKFVCDLVRLTCV